MRHFLSLHDDFSTATRWEYECADKKDQYCFHGLSETTIEYGEPAFYVRRIRNNHLTPERNAYPCIPLCKKSYIDKK